MDPTKPQNTGSDGPNRLPSAGPSTLSAPSAPKPPLQAAPTQPPPWASQTSTFPAQGGPSPSYPQFSAATAEILKRLQANQGNATGTPAFEAKRAEVLQNYVTSDKLPTPPPIANSGRRGRGGGRVGTPSALKTDVGVGPAGATPTSGRGSGRGRGRGRGGGRGGKRKRAESVESDDDDSDISSSYTPLPTRTKSGRNVNKPVAFVPTLPEPTPGVKRRRSTKTILAAQCKTCHRGTDPGNNRIVFCDVCNTAYHQYCHDPPIDNDVVNVLEKEWLCSPCERSKQVVIEGTDGLIAGEGLSIDDKRAYFSTLSPARLVSLLLHATIRHPELPIFPPNIHDLIPEQTSSSTSKPTAPITARQPTTPANQPVTSPPNGNGHGSTSGTPRSQNLATDSSEMDPAEAQLLGEIRSHRQFEIHQTSPSQPSTNPNPNPNPNPTTTSTANNNGQLEEYDDGYDTDPPAHYPKAGNGLARTLRPESEDLQWLVDDNFEVFSHGWKGDGSGVGPDGTLNGLGEGMEGVEHGSAKVA